MNAASHTQMIALELIDVPARLRQLDEDVALWYAVSIEASGLHQEIKVRPMPHDRFELVAGRHRLRAHELVGLSEIRCNVQDLTDEEAELVEVEENLLRNPLTSVEHVLSVGLWMKSYRADHPEISHGGDRKSDAAKTKFQSLELDRADQVLSGKIGRSKSSLYEDEAIFSALGVETLMELRESPIANNMAQLKALAKLPADQQKACADALTSGEQKSVKSWREAVGDLPVKNEGMTDQEIWQHEMMARWHEGKKKWQDKFLREIGVLP